MDRADIPFLTVAALGELIRSREVSPVEAAEAYVDRVEALNSAIRACAGSTWPRTLALLEELERQRLQAEMVG